MVVHSCIQVWRHVGLTLCMQGRPGELESSTLEGRATTLSARAWAAVERKATVASTARRGVNDTAAIAVQHLARAATDSTVAML